MNDDFEELEENDNFDDLYSLLPVGTRCSVTVRLPTAREAATEKFWSRDVFSHLKLTQAWPADDLTNTKRQVKQQRRMNGTLSMAIRESSPTRKSMLASRTETLPLPS